MLTVVKLLDNDKLYGGRKYLILETYKCIIDLTQMFDDVDEANLKILGGRQYHWMLLSKRIGVA